MEDLSKTAAGIYYNLTHYQKRNDNLIDVNYYSNQCNIDKDFDLQRHRNQCCTKNTETLISSNKQNLPSNYSIICLKKSPKTRKTFFPAPLLSIAGVQN